MARNAVAVSASIALLVQQALTMNNGLARTPQMGWNNWNALGCNVSESLLLDTSMKMVSTGLRDLGYNYVVLDDCWSAGRDPVSKWLVPDAKKFPRGMKHVADNIHGLDLLFGMYSSAGEMTCAHFEGSLDHETEDAKAFASWDVDYLKYDNCFHLGRFGTPQVSFNRYNTMSKALNVTGRPMLYSLCNWGEDYVHTWGMSIANSWRMSGDIYDSFSRPDALCSCTDPADPHCISPGSHCSVLNIINRVASFADRAQPGGWNDLDMLEVGNGGMTDDEYKAHFTMWAALKSPLLMGNDLRTLSAESLTILNNPAILAINQDPLGKSALLIKKDPNVKKDKYGQGETQIWSGPLVRGDHIVIFFNAADEDLEMEVTLEEIFYHYGPEGSAPQLVRNYTVYDPWATRMDTATAQQILDAGNDVDAAHKIFKKAEWYNVTDVNYEDGLTFGDDRLLGLKTGRLERGQVLWKTVKRHSVEVFRIRPIGVVYQEMFIPDDDKPRQKIITKDEL